MHGHALTTTARIDVATRVDDGLEVTRQWNILTNLTGMLSPLGLEVVNRLGLRPQEATHSLILNQGLSLGALDYRVVIGADAYDVVRVTNLPTHTIVLLRGTSAPASVPEPYYEPPPDEEVEKPVPPPPSGDFDEDEGDDDDDIAGGV
jgi:hypothetical protein